MIPKIIEGSSLVLTKSAHKNSLKLSLITSFDGQPAGLIESTLLNTAFSQNPYNAIKLGPTWIFLLIPLRYKNRCQVFTNTFWT